MNLSARSLKSQRIPNYIYMRHMGCVGPRSMLLLLYGTYIYSVCISAWGKKRENRARRCIKRQQTALMDCYTYTSVIPSRDVFYTLYKIITFIYIRLNIPSHSAKSAVIIQCLQRDISICQGTYIAVCGCGFCKLLISQ